MRLIYLFVTSLTATLAVIVTANFFVDPLAHFRVSDALFFSSDRQVKARLVETRKFDGLLLGSSKVAVIQPELAFPDQNVMNGAIGGARPEEILKFLQSRSLEIKWLGIGFDLVMFNENYNAYRVGEADTTSYSTLHYLLSIDTFFYSILTLYRRYVDDTVPQYTEFGALNPVVSANLACTAIRCDHARAMQNLKSNHFSSEFDLSSRRLEDVGKIAEWASRNKIDIVVWLNPLNGKVSDFIKQRLSSEMQSVRNVLMQKFGHFVDFSESYPDDHFYGKTDPFHFQSWVGTEMTAKCIAPIIRNFSKKFQRTNCPARLSGKVAGQGSRK